MQGKGPEEEAEPRGAEEPTDSGKVAPVGSAGGMQDPTVGGEEKSSTGNGVDNSSGLLEI